MGVLADLQTYLLGALTDPTGEVGRVWIVVGFPSNPPSHPYIVMGVNTGAGRPAGIGQVMRIYPDWHVLFTVMAKKGEILGSKSETELIDSIVSDLETQLGAMATSVTDLLYKASSTGDFLVDGEGIVVAKVKDASFINDSGSEV